METVGKRIHYFRKKRGLSRKELVKGICDESTLFRIEKEKITPNMIIVEELCKRLHITMSILFKEQYDERMRSTSDLKQLCRKHVYKRDFNKLSEDLNALKTNVYETSYNHPDQLFIIWHEAILLHNKSRQSKVAKELLLHHITFKPILETEIAMVNALGLVSLSLGERDNAFCYFEKAYNAVQNTSKLDDPTLFVRIGYNYASRLYVHSENQKAISVAESILTFLETNHLVFMRERVFHLLAKVHEKTGDYNPANMNMIQAGDIFAIEGVEESTEKEKEYPKDSDRVILDS